jgi:hypothetical protein
MLTLPTKIQVWMQIPGLVLPTIVLTTLALITASAPSRAAPLRPATSISAQGSDAAAPPIPVRAAMRSGSVRVAPRGGAVARGGGVGVRPRGNVAIRNAAVVAGGGRWARPFWYRWPVGGAIAAGAAIGFAEAANASPWAGPPPLDGMCWYYTDGSRSHGFWDYCPQ